MLVVTYNIQWGKGRDDVVDLARIARTIEAADIIALQEVERHWRPETGDQTAQLAALLPGHHWVFGAAVDLDGSSIAPDGRVTSQRRQYGNMILSRWPITSLRNWALTKYPVHGRMNDLSILMESVIAAPNGDLRVYNTHLNYLAADQRRLQVDEVLAVIGDAPRQGPVIVGPGMDDGAFEADGALMFDRRRPTMPQPAILLGDFNMEPTSPEYQRIVGARDPNYGRLQAADRLADALTVAGLAEDTGITFPESIEGPAQRIDHCFVTFDLIPAIRRAWIDDAADGSDHQPVWMEIQLADGRG
jgi:endonuclease/exonuclease/phosphatase family metal-dependent hydrolase